MFGMVKYTILGESVYPIQYLLKDINVTINYKLLILL